MARPCAILRQRAANTREGSLTKGQAAVFPGTPEGSGSRGSFEALIGRLHVVSARHLRRIAGLRCAAAPPSTQPKRRDYFHRRDGRCASTRPERRPLRAAPRSQGRSPRAPGRASLGKPGGEGSNGRVGKGAGAEKQQHCKLQRIPIRLLSHPAYLHPYLYVGKTYRGSAGRP